MKTGSLTVCLLVILTLSNLATETMVYGSLFVDHFDGASVDADKWVVSTDPPRIDYDGNWHTPSGDPSYGTVSLGDSWISLQNDSSTVFPYVMSKPSLFPEEGDFLLEFKMRYDTVNRHGAGFRVGYGDRTDPWNHLFSVWDDATIGNYPVVELLGTNWQSEELDTSEHVYALEYASGEYTVLIDENPILGPVASEITPDWLWFGNPVWASWGSYPWTTLSLNYVVVTPEPTTLLLLGFGGLTLLRGRKRG